MPAVCPVRKASCFNESACKTLQFTSSRGGHACAAAVNNVSHFPMQMWKVWKHGEDEFEHFHVDKSSENHLKSSEKKNIGVACVAYEMGLRDVW